MKAVYAPLGFALGASAALIPRDQCCFSLTASGGKSGVLGQLGDGQNRVGQTGGLTTQQATYCLNNGGLTDQNGRGCILTPPTTQFQCDVGASPTTGFSVNSNGGLTYNGNTKFYACSTGDNGGYNIYTTTSGAQTGCVEVSLNTGGKCASGNGQGSSSAPASSAPAGSQPAGSQPASSAPASSKPASSAPAGSQPAGSQPAGSQPASSAPAGSQPASSKPASSAPAGSQPAGSAPAQSGPQTQTVYSTHYQTITSCGPEVTSCPAESTVVHTTSAPVTNAPAPSSSGYACNPAHSYPNGAQCVSTNGGLSLVTPSASAPASSSGYACNPAHSYPNGAQCVSTNGGLSLVTPSATAPAQSASQPAGSQPASSAPASSAPASSAPAGSQPAGSQPASSAPAASGTSGSGTGNGNACQTSLTGAYQTPHAIIPVNKDQPSTSYGTQYNAYISSSNSTIFNFDIPQSYSGKQCSVIFLFPKQSQLETSSFTQTGSGGLKFDQLSSAAGLDVTYQNTPSVKSTLGSVGNVTPGNSYVVSTGSCQAGTTESIEVSSTGGLGLTFFEDWNPSPIGVFITSC